MLPCEVCAPFVYVSCGSVLVYVSWGSLMRSCFNFVFLFVYDVCLCVSCVFRVVVVVLVGVAGQVKRSCWPAAQYDRQ